jgi:hypothetical protein
MNTSNTNDVSVDLPYLLGYLIRSSQRASDAPYRSALLRLIAYLQTDAPQLTRSETVFIGGRIAPSTEVEIDNSNAGETIRKMARDSEAPCLLLAMHVRIKSRAAIMYHIEWQYGAHTMSVFHFIEDDIVHMERGKYTKWGRLLFKPTNCLST